MVDFYSLGVILHEFILGRKPYKWKDRKEIKNKMIHEPASIRKSEMPIEWSSEARDFTNSLLWKSPTGKIFCWSVDRMGSEGIEEILTHSWFDDIDWEKLERRELRTFRNVLIFIAPPYVPEKSEDNFLSKSVNKEDKWVKENKVLYDKSKQMLKHWSVQEHFKGYGYCP